MVTRKFIVTITEFAEKQPTPTPKPKETLMQRILKAMPPKNATTLKRLYKKLNAHTYMQKVAVRSMLNRSNANPSGPITRTARATYKLR